MAPYGYAITKKFPWRGGDEQFTNVYHYDSGDPSPNQDTFDGVINALVAKEKEKFGSLVQFVEGRAWGPTHLGKLQSITRLIKPLTGVGQVSTGGSIPIEFAIVLSFFLGRNPSTMRKRFLRKYYHLQRIPDTGAAETLGHASMSQAAIEAYQTWFNGFKTLTVLTSTHDISAPNGDHLPLGTPSVCLPHLHVRQLKQ